MATSNTTTKPTSIQQPDNTTPKPVTKTVTKVGNLVRDWEFHYSPNGTPVARNALAVNGWGDSKDTTTFYDLVAFKSLAENLSACTRKGNRLIVSGKPQIREWETSSGEKRTTKEILVNDAGIELRFVTAEILVVERSPQLPNMETSDEDDVPF